jgi:alpha-L-fucosidase
MKKKNLVFLMCLFATINSFGQANAQDKKMEWWREARFGMFIHWGVYAEMGGYYRGIKQQNAGTEWIMNFMKIPVQEYVDSAKTFNPVNYNPDAWAKMAKDAGMKYLVITTKHHDGFALFKSNVSKWNVVDGTVYGKDLIKPLAEACRKYGLKLGFYFSHAQDWVNPGGGVGRKLANLGYANPDSTKIDAYSLSHNGHWDPEQDKATYDEFVDAVSIPQLKEILSNYGDVVVLFWDTPAKTTPAQVLRFQEALKPYPNLITNRRLDKTYRIGDYDTPEQTIPTDEQLDGSDWETNMTMNNSWGFLKTGNRWKSSSLLIQNLLDITSKGGNYLLNVGPAPDGSFPVESVAILKDFGKWMDKYSEAIYGTRANPIANVSWGRITAKDKANKTTLYLSVFDWPKDGKLTLDSIGYKVKNIRLLGSSNKPSMVQKNNTIEITGLPAVAPDANASVIAVTFNEKLPLRKYNQKQKIDNSAVDTRKPAH